MSQRPFFLFLTVLFLACSLTTVKGGPADAPPQRDAEVPFAGDSASEASAETEPAGDAQQAAAEVPADVDAVVEQAERALAQATATTQPTTAPATRATNFIVVPPPAAAPAETAEPVLLDETDTRTPLERAQDIVEGFAARATWVRIGQIAITVLVVIIVASIVLRVGRRLLNELQESRRLPEAVMIPVRRLLRWTIYVIAVLVALSLSGVSIFALWTTLSAILALIAVGFIAVWSILSNLMSSFLLMIFKPFRIGDQVELVDNPAGPNVGGRVIDVTLMYTVMREEDEEGNISLVQIPNNLFFQKTVRRRAGKRAIPLEQHVEKHGLVGREKEPPPDPNANGNRGPAGATLRS